MSTLEEPEGDPGWRPPEDGDDAPAEAAESDDPTAAGDEPDASAEAPSDDADPDPDPKPEPDAEPDEPGSTLERSEQDDPLDRDEIAIDPAHVRRAPRYGRFAILGALLGVVAAFVSAPFATYGEPGMVMDTWGMALLLAAILAPVGILLGCAIALLADRRSRRETRKS